jgi:hypothetical protein
MSWFRPQKALDHHLVHESPAPLYMGELPGTWDDVPARAVVNLCGAFPSGDARGRAIFCLPMLDALDSELLPERDLFERFLESVHAYARSEPTYWHCHAGINRSGMSVAAYLHIHRGLKISDAIGVLRERRSKIVLCNGTFEETLRKWYGGPDEQAFEPVAMETYLIGRERRP